MNKKSDGFTIVEMMVTLFVGSLLIAVFYQLFVSIVQYGSDSRYDSTASGIVSQTLRKYPTTYSVSNTTNCTAGSTPIEILPSNEQSGTDTTIGSYTKSLRASCPYTASPTITLLQATVSYNNGTKSVSQAVYVN